MLEAGLQGMVGRMAIVLTARIAVDTGELRERTQGLLQLQVGRVPRKRQLESRGDDRGIIDHRS